MANISPPGNIPSRFFEEGDSGGRHEICRRHLVAQFVGVLIPKGIEAFDRINVLTYLYLPPDVNNKHVEYKKAIYQFSREVEDEDIKDDERKNLGIFQKNHPIIFHNYFDKYNDLTTSLQRLVK
jgi:hypothetical protein